MALQYSEDVRNAKLDAIESTIGTNVNLLIYSGPIPDDCASAPSGVLLVAIDLPADWMAAASGGVKAKNGTWQGTAIATGIADHFRICNGSPTDICKIQGKIETTGGSPTGEMGLDNINISVSQTVTVTSFQLTSGNA